MCGICGIFGSPERGALEAMSKSLASRGPDDSAMLIDGPMGLAFRRLSIIDLEGGRQPVFNEDGSLCVILNGEIYNYRQLRSYLSSIGHFFSTNSDTEVIVHAFEEFGESCVRHLRGMFAFAVWDLSAKKLFLARDRFGIKPLFFSQTKGSFVFASDVKSLLSSGLVPREIDPESLCEQAIFGCMIDDSTFFRGVKRLLPGHTLTVDSSGSRLNSYWSSHVSSEPSLQEDEASKRLSSLFSDAVGLETVSDVGFGVLLSGGLDSSAITAAASSFSGGPVSTFSVSDDESSEDIQSARLVSEHLGTDHHEFLVSADDAISAFPDYILSVADVSPHFVYGAWMHLLSQRVAMHQKVVLCAQGSDELFAGYEYLSDAHHFRREHLEARWAHFSPQGGFRRAGFFSSLVSDISSRGPDAVLSYELSSPLPNNQLALVDAASMRFGLEVRAPFLDTELANFAMRIPFSLKVNNGIEKYILRKAVSALDLPREILLRKKNPAGASTIPRFSSKLGSLADDLISDRYFHDHKYAHLLVSKPAVLSFDLLEHFFIENPASIPPGFEPSSLY